MMRKNKNANYTADSRVGTLIGKGVVFDGNLSAPESIRIDGTVNGNCDCKAQLIVGGDGVIKGDINAQDVLISGNVEGNILANGKIELLSTGIILGNIKAKSLVIDEGGNFDGRCTMMNSTNNASAGELTTYEEGYTEDNNTSQEEGAGLDSKRNKRKW